MGTRKCRGFPVPPGGPARRARGRSVLARDRLPVGPQRRHPRAFGGGRPGRGGAHRGAHLRHRERAPPAEGPRRRAGGRPPSTWCTSGVGECPSTGWSARDRWTRAARRGWCARSPRPSLRRTRREWLTAGCSPRTSSSTSTGSDQHHRVRRRCGSLRGLTRTGPHPGVHEIDLASASSTPLTGKLAGASRLGPPAA